MDSSGRVEQQLAFSGFVVTRIGMVGGIPFGVDRVSGRPAHMGKRGVEGNFSGERRGAFEPDDDYRVGSGDEVFGPERYAVPVVPDFRLRLGYVQNSGVSVNGSAVGISYPEGAQRLV